MCPRAELIAHSCLLNFRVPSELLLDLCLLVDICFWFTLIFCWLLFLFDIYFGWHLFLVDFCFWLTFVLGWHLFLVDLGSDYITQQALSLYHKNSCRGRRQNRAITVKNALRGAPCPPSVTLCCSLFECPLE